MEGIKGYVDHIVYRNEENGYTVFQLNHDDGDLTCVGKFHFIEEGELLELTGEYTMHKIYGTQFAVETSRVCEPEDLVSIERYLGSGAVRGVGAALAGRIVKKFREETFRIMEEEPERLAEIKGISMRMARAIGEQVEEKKEMRNAMIFLQKYGVSTTLSAKIYAHYGQSLYRVMEENPYQIADQVSGVGFKTADEIARKMGFEANSDFRIKSGIEYALLQVVNDGHVYLEEDELVQRARVLLGVQVDNPEEYLLDLAVERKVIIKENTEESTDISFDREVTEQDEDPRRNTTRKIYASRYYYMELTVAKMLHDLHVTHQVDMEVLKRKLDRIREDTGLQLDELQEKAIAAAAGSGILILTGGPGTGKTTTINTMIHFFESEGMDILLAAPTGRAAKRMTEATGCEAQTIHRLLEVNGKPEESEGSYFNRNEENPLEADVIIIDEMSMVDLTLMNSLLHAIVPGTRLILVGDANQLPSVGPGAVLKDMIASKAFPTVMLNRIFRQAGESDIVVNAHKINRGETVTLDNRSKDFFFLKRRDPNMIISNCIELVRDKLPKYVDAAPSDIQIMTPTRKGLLGVERLNKILQGYLNPASPQKKEKEIGDRLFREGDKVMQIKNNYQLEWEIKSRYGLVVDSGLGIFNGDMGIVKEIDTYDEAVVVEYDECRLVRYPYALLEELEHAYAITIHKAQGSEYPAVVVPLLMGPKMLYNRNLLYTAITRAKKCVTIVGDEEVFEEMIQNTREQKRNTSLRERIEEVAVS